MYITKTSFAVGFQAVLMLPFLTLGFVPCQAETDQEESTIEWEVVSPGGQTGSDAIFCLSGTVGQTAVGYGLHTGQELWHGFWQIFHCCIPPTVGDIDQSGQVDITDIQWLVDNQFISLEPLFCEEEADTDLNGVVDISDLQLLIDNQFISLTPLPPCP